MRYTVVTAASEGFQMSDADGVEPGAHDELGPSPS